MKKLIKNIKRPILSFINFRISLLIALAAITMFQVERGGLAQSSKPVVKYLSPEANRFAILVGINKYNDKNIAALDDPANDVALLGETLTKVAGVPQDNIITLTSEVPDNAPTRANILKALSRVKYQVQPDTLLLFMFSGHGITTADGEAFLLPQDAVLTGDATLLSQTSLAVDEVRRLIASTKVTQAIVFLDACRNDPEQAKGVGDNPMSIGFRKAFDFDSKNKEISASLTLYATSVGYRAFVDPQRKLGYFTEALVEGLKGHTTSNNGDVSLATLLSYVQAAVPQKVTHDLPGSVQKPIYDISGYNATDLIIAHTSIDTSKQDSDSLLRIPRTTSTRQAATPLSTPIAPIPVPKTGEPDPRDPRTLVGVNLDYQRLFDQNKADELSLGYLGEAAFKNGNYDWTRKYLEQAKLVQSSKVWTGQYPYLAASYLLGTNDKLKFEQTLEEMLRAMTIPYTFLSHSFGRAQCVAKLNTIIALAPPDEVPFIKSMISRINALS